MTPDDRSGGRQQFNTLFENSGARNGLEEMDSLFLDNNIKSLRATVPAPAPYDPPPGFSADFLTEANLSSSLPRQFNGASNSRFDSSLDRAAVGENLIRSQSAAPSFDGRLADARLGLGPPGFATREGLSHRETPLVSNRTGGDFSNRTGEGDSYLTESVVDRSYIYQMAQRRPASTGVIGQTQNSSLSVLSSLGLGSAGGGAVRPAAKTLMDLIQEDFPESSMGGDGYDVYARENPYMERPRTTSPLSQQAREYVNLNRDDPFARDNRSSLMQALDRDRLRQGDNFSALVSAALQSLSLC